MAMLDKGRMLRVESREWFDTLRKRGEEEAAGLPEAVRLVRQFLFSGESLPRHGTGTLLF